MHTHKHLLAFIIIFQGSKKKEKHINSSICRFEHPSPKAHVLFSSSLFPMGKTQIRGVAQMNLPRLQIYNLHICGTLDFHCLVYLLGDSSIPGLCRCSSFQTWGSPGNHYFCKFKPPVLGLPLARDPFSLSELASCQAWSSRLTLSCLFHSPCLSVGLTQLSAGPGECSLFPPPALRCGVCDSSKNWGRSLQTANAWWSLHHEIKHDLNKSKGVPLVD